jgi:multiple sugar transport system substrate-binding protein
VLDGSEFKGLEPENKLAAELEYAHFPPPIPGVGDVLTEMYNGYQAAILGKADPASALKGAAQKANQILQQNLKKYGG